MFCPVNIIFMSSVPKVGWRITIAALCVNQPFHSLLKLLNNHVYSKARGS